MATQDFNNSYWTKKLLPFKEGQKLFISTASVIENGRESIEIDSQITDHLHKARYISALIYLASQYSAKDEIPIMDLRLNAEGRQIPLFYCTNIEHSWSVAELIASVETEIESAEKHQDYIFETVTRLLEIKQSAITSLGFCSAQIEKFTFSLPDIFISVKIEDKKLNLTVSYNTTLFSQEWVNSFLQQYLRILKLFASNGNCKLAECEFLSVAEKELIGKNFNLTTKEYTKDKTLHKLLEEQALQTPSAKAVVYQTKKLTYGELHAKANQMAHFLQERLKVKTADRVGVILRRSEKMVVALLAILKAGAAYVPINPKHPWAMLNYMVENAGIKTLIVDTDSVAQAATFSGELFIIDIELDRLDMPNNTPDIAMSSEELAYIIYTSGSTGQPKGVAIEHQSIVNTIVWRNHYYGINERDVNLQMPSFAFDSSVLDIFCVLSKGGCLVIPDEDLCLDAQYLKEVILEYKVTQLILTPSYYRVLLKELGNGGTLRSITIAGEATTPELVAESARQMPQVVLYNEYGPTENAVCSTACILKPGSATVSIGKPIDNVKIFILSKNLKLLPIGAPGEIFLGGVGLARGYLNQEALTAERFIPSPIPEVYTGRLYRTGDWGYWKPNGELDFIGRMDNQVKVRGFRIELDEIENKLLQHTDIVNAAVVCKGEGADKYLAAYIMADNSMDVEQIHGYLNNQLPYYMVPAVIRFLPELPLTFNGKVDRTLLKNINDHQAEESNEEPATAVEAALVKICSSLLQRTHLAGDDNFFDHGLNSLKIMEMVSNIRNQLQIQVALLDVYTFPTIKSLSRFIGAAGCKSHNTKMESTT